jgi:hypothetical protein
MEKPLSHHIENSFNIFNVILQFMLLNKNRVVGKFWVEDQRFWQIFRSRIIVAGEAPVWSMLAMGAPVFGSVGRDSIRGDGFGVMVHNVAQVDLGFIKNPKLNQNAPFWI